MDRQQRTLLDDIGGEPLEGSGFEQEQSVTEDDIEIADPKNQQTGEQI